MFEHTGLDGQMHGWLCACTATGRKNGTLHVRRTTAALVSYSSPSYFCQCQKISQIGSSFCNVPDRAACKACHHSCVVAMQGGRMLMILQQQTSRLMCCSPQP